MAIDVGIRVRHVKLPKTATEAEVRTFLRRKREVNYVSLQLVSQLEKLNEDPAVNGIIVQVGSFLRGKKGKFLAFLHENRDYRPGLPGFEPLLQGCDLFTEKLLYLTRGRHHARVTVLEDLVGPAYA